MELNIEQQYAYDCIIDFLKDEDKKQIALIGRAGTGKTALITKIFKDLEDVYEDINVCFYTPTHKALSVLKEKNRSKFCYCTLHSLLGLSPKIDLLTFDPDNLEFGNGANSVISFFKVIIIDEASMVNEKLYNLITEKCKNTKIIFLGDEAQLPPIGEKKSKCLQIESVVLNEIMRTDILEIKNICNRIRNKIQIRLEDYIGGTNVKTLTSKQVENLANLNEYIILSFKNENVSKWNKYVKSTVSNKLFDSNEKLILKKPIEIDDTIINNGEIVIVKHYEYVSDNKIYLQIYYDNKTYILKVELDINKYEKEKKDLIEKIRKGEKQWKYYYEVFKRENLILGEDFDYCYALTIHKSQGSTFNKVIVNTKDIQGDLAKQILYVAVTRVKEELIFMV